VSARRATVALAAVLAAAAPAHAKPPTPAELVQRAVDQMLFRARGAEMTMRLTLRGKGGDVRTRQLYSKSRMIDGQSRALVRFLAPSEVAGTAFLFLERKGGADEQHMYLPALKIVRRIAGEQKRASFMGSDFTYADLQWSDLGGAACARAGQEKIGGHPCVIVDCTPPRRDVYARLRAFVRAADGAPVRFEFYDARAELAKTLFVKELKPVAGAPMATALRMLNHRTGGSTELVIERVTVRDDLPASDFTVEALRPR
jgi:hypothetical protein